MQHVVLLGDSIFDNGRYVEKLTDTTLSHLQRALPAEWTASMVAVDGHVTRYVARQLQGISADASHLMVSVGGNDALQVANRWTMLEDLPFGKVAEQLAHYQQQFRHEYRKMLSEVQVHRLPTAVCTIYTAVPNLPPDQVAALSYFNDVIMEEAARAKVAVVDLRLICVSPADYSARSPIEPSKMGGRKIAQALAALAVNWNSITGPATVVIGPVK